MWTRKIHILKNTECLSNFCNFSAIVWIFWNIFYFLCFFYCRNNLSGVFSKKISEIPEKKAYNHVKEYVWSRKLINKSWVSYISFSEVLTLFYKTLSAGYFWICPCDNIIVTIGHFCSVVLNDTIFYWKKNNNTEFAVETHFFRNKERKTLFGCRQCWQRHKAHFNIKM